MWVKKFCTFFPHPVSFCIFLGKFFQKKKKIFNWNFLGIFSKPHAFCHYYYSFTKMYEQELAQLCAPIKTLYETEQDAHLKRVLFRILRGIGACVRDVDFFNTLLLSRSVANETDKSIITHVCKKWDQVELQIRPPLMLHALAVERRYFTQYMYERSGLTIATEMSTVETKKRSNVCGDAFQNLKTVPLPTDTTCVICHENISQGCVLSCGHMYHSDCIRKWGEESNKCPTCMQPHVGCKKVKK